MARSTLSPYHEIDRLLYPRASHMAIQESALNSSPMTKLLAKNNYSIRNHHTVACPQLGPSFSFLLIIGWQNNSSITNDDVPTKKEKEDRYRRLASTNHPVYLLNCQNAWTLPRPYTNCLSLYIYNPLSGPKMFHPALLVKNSHHSLASRCSLPLGIPFPGRT